MYGEVATREIAVAPLHQSVAEPISCLQFSTGLEVLWAGSASGGLYTLHCQAALQRYSCVRAHESRVHDMCGLGNGVLSLSSDRWRCHSAGGLSKLTFMDPEVTDLAACEFEPGSASRVMLGREGGGMLVYDLEAQKPAAKAEVEGGVLMMRAPVGRGLVAIGNAAGQLVLTDPRAGYKVEHSLTAHSGGLEALDARGNFVATCGYGTRLGQVALDNMVKVFDLRSAPRLLNTVPFRPGPSLLRFHPKFSSTLLIGSQAGIFTLSDIQGTAPGPTYQIETEGDAITACAFSSSGEMMAFGGSGGYAHLWATSATPRVNMASQPLDFPTLTAKPPRLTEQDSFALPFPYGVTQTKLLSDFSFPAPMQMRQPPRIIPPALLKDVRQVEFVGYVANPMYKRGAAPGEATKAVAALRNMRHQPKQASLNAAANAARTRGGSDSDKSSPRHKGPRGATWLPSRYRLQRVHVQRQAGLRWAEEFDFTFYNRTRFAGLENGVANCYVNSLVQVLFFIPAVRKAMLSIIPEPEKEFSLSCEMSLLFRMLYTARGSVCQASNLFRALRQNKEAAALGLLEGHAQQGPRDKDIEVETQKDRSLRRRIQSLQCFLFEQLHRELTQSSPRAPPGFAPPAKAPSEAILPTTEPPTTATTDVTATSPPHAKPATRKSIIDATFGLAVRQRTKVTTGLQADKLRESRSFQVELHYPPAKDRPPVQSPTVSGASPKAAAAGKSKRPRFCDVLARSLKPQADLRAWFDEQLGYQPVQQTRIPLNMPNVLAMTCGLTDGADLAWWQPWRTSSTHRPWLPWAIAVQVIVDEWRVEVQEGERFQDLLKQQHDAPPDGKVARAVYELTAVVAHVVDAAENSPAGTAPEGHLVAHVKVLPQDVDSQYGIAHSPIGPSPSQSPLAFRPFGSAPTGPPSAYSSALARTASASNNSNMSSTALARTASATGSGNISRLSESTSREEVTGISDGPRVSSEVTGVSSGEVLTAAQGSQQSLTTELAEDKRHQSAPGLEPADGPALEKSNGSGQIADRYRKLSLVAPPASVTGLSSASSRHVSDGQPPSPSTSSPAYRRPDWLLFNDFSITPCAPAEVLTLFGNQKVPCLLYYSRVDRALTPAEASVPPAPPSPVLTTESFQALCSGPPVQGPSVKRHARNFEPLSPEELRAPGLLLGIDAEFVAHAPAEKVMQGGVEVEVCKARLGLARVSVVRGEGPAAGSPAIDDYIRSLEPISDYLTKWSGLVPGDLDPKVSPHYLTTMKKAYLKLRYLVDSGCIFVGHDLRHDFKSINIIVPPQQVIDTVFLFHFKRQRKLSLRFLAGYLLGEDIQQNTHDSIEDARTAVKLYQKYKQLVSEGRFQETLLEMYRWGKQHAWDPLALRPPSSPA
ncbi:hypothetical protein WJX82_005488 [Trebouxia sp. C0006]